MKKLISAVAVCCVFSVHVIATNSNAKLNDIEKKKGLKNETKIPEIPTKAPQSTFLKKLLEETEHDVKALKSATVAQKLESEINNININLNIDKANIKLIKAEIKEEKRQKYLLSWQRLSLSLPSLRLRA